MKSKSILTILMLVTLLVSLAQVSPAAANPPAPGDAIPVVKQTDTPVKLNTGKSIDQPNMLEVMKLRARDLLLKQGNVAAAQELMSTTDRVLVVLVEFAGSDSFTWTPGVSTWDPVGKAEATTDGTVVPGNCAVVPGVPATETVFKFGPTLHNTIPKPLSAADRSGDTIWTSDFSPSWFKDFMFGNGVVMDYSRADESVVHEDFTGKSVTKFYEDMSGGKYHVNGDVVGWLQLNHSAWWYGADPCPGARSGPAGGFPNGGGIPDAGSARSLVKDAVDAVDAIKDTIPGFSWANYDQDGDGVIDRLWIVHAGYGEEDSTALTNRTDYGEAAMWSHSSALSPEYSIGTSGMKAGAYIMMPENGGIGVFAHEYGHNLGADDLYSYAGGETSAGFWTTMADDWTGYPIGFQPPAVDPMHLDRWGWLDPTVITDPSKEYIVTVGQASNFPGGDGVTRGVKIVLPDGKAPLPIGPANGDYMWYGGGKPLMNSMMTLKSPLAIPANGATLNFNLAYDIEPEWDFLWVQASKDGGTNWLTLSNPAVQSCKHDVGWIGELNGFPTDLCAAGIYGFTGDNPSVPSYDPMTFTLSSAEYGGQNVLLRFWYMTDWGTQWAGAFIDDVVVFPGAAAIKPAVVPTPLFSDGAENGDTNWTYAEEWIRSDGTKPFPQNYYLQFRNTGPNGGYDSGLGDPRFRYGPANSGLLVWYNNGFYNDNEVMNYLTDYPGFGPKGMMLVVDAHPEPYRDPYWVSQGYPNEGSNLDSRGSMRDAAFSLNQTNSFWANPPYTYASTYFPGPASLSFFDDSQGYYPGAEFQPGGPVGQMTSRWMTKMWDTSVVMPSTEFYGIKAPGYNGTDRMRFGCSLGAAMQVLCYSYATGLGYAGSNWGRPDEVDGQYGWKVQIVSQTDKTATLKIWNEKGTHTFDSDKTLARQGDLITYTYKLIANPALGQRMVGCTDLDTTKEEFVSGVGVLPLASSCASFTGIAPTGITPSATKVKAVGFVKNATDGSAITYQFTVKPTVMGGTLNHTVNLFESGTLYKSIAAQPVTVNTLFYYLSLLFR